MKFQRRGCPAVPVSGQSKHLTSLKVSGEREPSKKLGRSVSSDFGFKATVLEDLIRAALKLLTFREEHVLVQLWSPQDVGKRRLLTTVDQPYCFGAADEELLMYRSCSEGNRFLVDKENEEEGSCPPARVYMRGLPEWTPDITNYMAKDFPLQECALLCNLRGYLALPVFDPARSLCVGVLELLTSSKNTVYAYEVKQIHRALKTVNLRTLQVVGQQPTSNVPRQKRMDKIHHILKVMCEEYDLPLAQTWALSRLHSYVACEKILKKSCSSFNTRCIGKACMSTTDLPFYVRELGKWSFMEACRERHLEKSRGCVGRSWLSRGSCFCGDVSALDEEEYPLVYDARMSRLTGCFTIFLRDDDDDDEYVLEFFLPIDAQDARSVLELVQTLEEMIKVTSGFELGDVSSIEVVEPTGTGVQNLSLNSDMESSDSESIVVNVLETENFLQQGRKRKKDSLTVKATFMKDMIRFLFHISSGLLELKNQVAQRLKLQGTKLLLKYKDEHKDDDLVLIACDHDLYHLLRFNTTLKLIVELVDD